MDRGKMTLTEIAEQAGVSIGTVHRSIYGKPGVGEETRKRILDIVRESNYQINEAASVLKRGETVIAVVLPSVQDEDRFYFRGIWAGIRAAAANLERYKVSFDFTESKYPLEKIHRGLGELYDENVENLHGLVTIADTPDAADWVSRFTKRGVQVILLSSHEQDVNCLASIRADHYRCGQLAANFLSYALHRKTGKLLFLSGQADAYSNWSYGRGFQDGLPANGMRHSLIHVEGLGRTEIIGKCREVLATQKLEGIFALNARNTMAICELLDAANLKEKPVVVGTDVFTELHPYFENGVLDALIYQSPREQGEKAISLIYEHVTRNQVPEKIIQLPPILVMKSNFESFST